MNLTLLTTALLGSAVESQLENYWAFSKIDEEGRSLRLLREFVLRPKISAKYEARGFFLSILISIQIGENLTIGPLSSLKSTL